MGQKSVMKQAAKTHLQLYPNKNVTFENDTKCYKGTSSFMNSHQLNAAFIGGEGKS